MLSNDIRISFHGLLDVRLQQEQIINMTRDIHMAVGSITAKFQEIDEKIKNLTAAVEKLSPGKKLCEKSNVKYEGQNEEI